MYLPVYTSIHDIQDVTARDAPLQELEANYKVLVTQKEDLAQDIKKYWNIRHELAMIDSMAVKGK